VKAPEVYEHKEYKYTDVFALGMVIFCMLTGERPYADAIVDEIPLLIKSGKRPDTAKLPVEYRYLVSRCWEHGMVVCLVGLVSLHRTPQAHHDAGGCGPAPHDPAN
jgi:serine/threonine protein kinase